MTLPTPLPPSPPQPFTNLFNVLAHIANDMNDNEATNKIQWNTYPLIYVWDCTRSLALSLIIIISPLLWCFGGVNLFLYQRHLAIVFAFVTCKSHRTRSIAEFWGQFWATCIHLLFIIKWARDWVVKRLCVAYADFHWIDVFWEYPHTLYCVVFYQCS